MVLSSSPALQDSQVLMSISCRLGNHLMELLGANVERARAGHQNPSRTQHFHGAQVELLISAEGFVEIALAFGKRRRIENDGVVSPFGRIVIPQKVEGVGLNPL